MADRSQPFPIFEKVRYGNGMLVNFKRGKGEFFCAGSCKRVAGLPHCYPVERVTANVLNHISSNGTRTKQSMNIQASERARTASAAGRADRAPAADAVVSAQHFYERMGLAWSEEERIHAAYGDAFETLAGLHESVL